MNEMELTVETFEGEILEALKSYDKFIVCVDKTPDECKAALGSLMDKAIRAYTSRGPSLRHGIALDKQVTIISEPDGAGPALVRHFYFNLHSPYKKKVAAKAKKED